MAAIDQLNNIKTILNIQDFKQLLQTSSAAEIEKIPLECLPRVIPDELLNATSGSIRKVLENIIFELNMREVSERVEIESRYNQEISGALFYFSDYFGKENFARLNNKLTELGLLYKTWKIDEDEQKRLALLPKIKELNALIEVIRHETKSVIDAKAILEKNLNQINAEDAGQFTAEIENLQYVINRNQQKMSQYYYLRLLVVGADMRHLSTKIKDSTDLVAIVQDSINQNHSRLKSLTGSSFLPRRPTKNSQETIDKLRKETNDLLAQKQALEVPISETALIAWLDVVVDATLTGDAAPASAKALIGRTRMTLFHLLQQYCMKQEDAALDVAKNPFSQASPEDVIKFLLQSEQFILQYFKKKRLETAAWMGDLADSKVDMLASIEKDLLKELKKNSKHIN